MRITDNMKGALLMVAAMAGFVGNDGLIRIVLEDLPFFQTLLLRGILLSASLAAVTYAMNGFMRPAKRDLQIMGWRAVAEFLATLAFLTALTLMPFATLSAVLQFVPLSVTLAAAVFLGAPVGWRRMVAIAVGLVGVLLIIQPGSDAFNPATLFALSAVVAVTIREIVTRLLSHEIPSVLVAFCTATALTLAVGVLSLTEDWAPVSGYNWMLLIGCSLFLTIAFVASVGAMRIGDVAAVAPFRYTSLVIALIIGVIVFDEIPNRLALIGAAIVVGMGLFSFYRERVTAR